MYLRKYQRVTINETNTILVSYQKIKEKQLSVS